LPAREATLTQAIQYLQNVGAIAFVLLGVATAVGWARRRDRSLGYLALAIVLLSLVSPLGSIPKAYAPPFLPQITLLVFIGSGYALLRFRGSLIPLTRAWHAFAVIAVVAAYVAYEGSLGLAAAHYAPQSLLTGTAVVFILVWSAMIVEPIIRFWLVARDLPAVQAWRLRSLSIGFGGLVALLLVAIGSLAFKSNPLFEFLIQLSVLLIVPLLYVSFSPPSWLRRQWRSSEEEGLRVFMQDKLLAGEDPVALLDQSLEWAMRLVGGAAAVAFDGSGTRMASRGLDTDQLRELEQYISLLEEGEARFHLGGVSRTLLVLPIAGSQAAGRLVVVAGPFTPSFGSDGLTRVQQFISAVATAVDRARLLEKVKEANAELVDANRHKTVFLANMSHELRTPLNAILGFSELLIDSKNGQFPPDTRLRFLEQIHTSGKHLLGLINDILDLSKIEAGQMELRLQMVSVADVVSQVTSIVEPLVVQKQLHLKSDAVGAGQILADEGKLKQMILNLVSNAIKFTPAGGTVTVTAGRVGDRLEIVVSDNGMGIAEHDLDRLFKEFQQIDSGANRKQQGTGLGLVLTRRLAVLHGGNVRAESELGTGSRFTIDLPIESRSPDRAPRASSGILKAAVVDLSRPLVLVVEDDPASAELLSRQIEGAGFRTENARNGIEAMAMAKERKPVAITLDILLPEVDGWEVMTLLKRDEATSDIPVIIVSVVDDPELGKALGALDYFVKPVNAKELVQRLSNYNFKSGDGKALILVVDDEAANRDWLKHVLEPLGFTVLIASGGQEAIELARSRKPALVMLDLLMPDVNGFDVVEALSGNEATKAIPIMVLTAKSLTRAEIDQLNGRVSIILKRGSTGAVALLSQLHAVLNRRAVEV
jgi:signal transduction histidine kinase/CheY-like chemotaxis protein